MNILILFTQPWKIGGAETHVEALIKGLYMHNIYLAINKGSNDERIHRLKKKYKNLEIIEIQSRGINIFKWKKSLDKLKRIIITKHIDVISAQQRTAGIWAWRLYKSTSIKYTVTMHDPWHRAKLKNVYAKIFPKMIVVSKNLAQILYEQYNFDKNSVTLINNGVDFSLFKPMDKKVARDKLLLNTKEKMILHVSRFSNTKGAVALLIIKTMEFLAKKKIFYKLVIIGEGPLKDKIKERAKVFNEKYGNWIIVKNFVEDIYLWYNATDILIGEGRIAIETLACEKPIIAIRNDKNFIGKITKENIKYACDVNFDGKDKVATSSIMAEEILETFQVNNSECKNIAIYIKERLNIDKMAKSYLDIFRSL